MVHLLQFNSIQFSRSVMSDCLLPKELQHARPPCPSPTPGVHRDSRPLSQWCHPTMSSSVFPFSSCLQSSQHQGLFQWVNPSHQVAKVLEFQLQHQSFQRTPSAGSLHEELRPWQRSEEGGLTYTKAGLSLRSPPGNFRASTPQNQSLPTLLLCALTYTSDFMGGCPPPPSLS